MEPTTSANFDELRQWLSAISAAYELMATVRIPERLANAAVIRKRRPQIWIDASGLQLFVEISCTVELEDQRDLTSYVEIQLGSSEWIVKARLGRLDEGEDTIWRGREVVGRDVASLHHDLTFAAAASLDAMLFNPRLLTTLDQHLAEADRRLRGFARRLGITLPPSDSNLRIVPCPVAGTPYGHWTGSWAERSAFVTWAAAEGRRWLNVGLRVDASGIAFLCYELPDRGQVLEPLVDGLFPSINLNGPPR